MFGSTVDQLIPNLVKLRKNKGVLERCYIMFVSKKYQENLNVAYTFLLL